MLDSESDFHFFCHILKQHIKLSNFCKRTVLIQCLVQKVMKLLIIIMYFHFTITESIVHTQINLVTWQEKINSILFLFLFLSHPFLSFLNFSLVFKFFMKRLATSNYTAMKNFFIFYFIFIMPIQFFTYQFMFLRLFIFCTNFALLQSLT